jgi:GTP diphosphokinase / guanosine-3',5'-bis(diphosphate) 3'-diphosphatase
MGEAALLSAISFAADKHRNQRRKDHEASPYINHTIAVATLLATEGNVDDETVLIAAVLHDTVEDTNTTFEELEKEFGPEVADIVREVTDDKTLAKEVRKLLQIENARKASPRAKQLKIADKICNIKDVLESPPKDWSLERRREYLQWAAKVVDGCRGVNPGLEKSFDKLLLNGKKKLIAVKPGE